MHCPYDDEARYTRAAFGVHDPRRRFRRPWRGHHPWYAWPLLRASRESALSSNRSDVVRCESRQGSPHQRVDAGLWTGRGQARRLL